jgi:putative ABC transport system ATP-binding protein
VPLIEVRALVKDYRRGNQSIRALNGVELAVERGEFVSIMGPSGSGKSTLLHMLGGLDTPTSGSVVVDERDLANLDDESLTEFRRHRLGFVFQFFNLLPTLSAWENVALPRLLDGVRLGRLRSQAVTLLDRVGLADRVDHRPAEMSGGQLQRVAIARALMADPVLVLADEPTGNLDSESGAQVLALLRECTTQENRTLVMVTHDAAAAGVGDRIVRLVDGRVSEELRAG